MPWQMNIFNLIGKPIGISFQDGTGTSGILCDVRNNTLYVQEYMYQDFFALKQYPFHMIADVHGFPPCASEPRPMPRPYPWVY